MFPLPYVYLLNNKRIEEFLEAFMSEYAEELPTEVNPDNLPLRQMAPCWSDGSVITTDYDTKDATCECQFMICLVDWRNIVISSRRK